MATELRPRIQAISMDVLGMFGSVRKFTRVIPRSEFPFTHVEVIGLQWSHRLSSVIRRVQDEGFEVSEIHARTGFSRKNSLLNTLLLAAITPTMLPTQKIINTFRQHEILIHAPEANRIGLSRLAAMSAPKRWWIEDHDEGAGGVGHALNAVSLLRQHDKPANVMLDLVHLIGPQQLTPSQFYKKWDWAIGYVAQMTASPRGLIGGIHFPIGSRSADSLPMHLLGDQQLSDMARAIGPSVDRLVIENQRDGALGLLYVRKKYEPDVRRRYSSIFERMAKAGLLKF